MVAGYYSVMSMYSSMCGDKDLDMMYKEGVIL